MATTGTVEYLKVVEDGIAFFKVDTTTFILWKFSEINFEQLLWYSMLKEAVASGKTVTINHAEDSAIPSMVQLNDV